MRATSVDGWISSASESLQSVVRVGWRIPRSIWLTNVRSTLALKASASCDIPRELRCSRSTCPNRVGMWSAMVAYGHGACGCGSTGYILPPGARPHCGAAFAVRPAPGAEMRSLRIPDTCQNPRRHRHTLTENVHALRGRNHQSGAVLRFREHRPRGARCALREVRHHPRARAAAAEGLHRRQEGVLRLGALQGI